MGATTVSRSAGAFLRDSGGFQPGQCVMLSLQHSTRPSVDARSCLAATRYSQATKAAVLLEALKFPSNCLVHENYLPGSAKRKKGVHCKQRGACKDNEVETRNRKAAIQQRRPELAWPKKQRSELTQEALSLRTTPGKSSCATEHNETLRRKR